MSTQRQKIIANEKKQRILRSFISCCSWNPGPSRQGLDVGLFMKNWAVGMLQEATILTCNQLQMWNNQLVVDHLQLEKETSHTPVVFMSGNFASSAEKIGSINEVTENGNWTLKAVFGKFSLKSSIGSIETLRVGSAHLHSNVARRFVKSQAPIKRLLDFARQEKIDLIGVDLNKAANTHAKHTSEFSSFMKVMKECHDKYNKTGANKPLGLLGHCAPEDCTGIIIPPWSQLFCLKLNRHGCIPLKPKDIGLRREDTEFHRPAFCYWHFPSNERQRSLEMSAARAARKKRKQEKLKDLVCCRYKYHRASG